ncbi:hypothetical protein H6786_02165 [Candidatus Nomurabacteria bacterium]|nr:hypothetical protein [Candidatus Nomurabacteria bacterium]
MKKLLAVILFFSTSFAYAGELVYNNQRVTFPGTVTMAGGGPNILVINDCEITFAPDQPMMLTTPKTCEGFNISPPLARSVISDR